MKIFRITAESCDPTSETKGFRVYLICGLESDNSIAEGEWMGYAKQKGNIYPFLLRPNGKLIYGMEEPYLEITDLVTKRIEVGGYFTIELDPEIDNAWATVYRIIALHSYHE